MLLFLKHRVCAVNEMCMCVYNVYIIGNSVINTLNIIGTHVPIILHNRVINWERKRFIVEVNPANSSIIIIGKIIGIIFHCTSVFWDYRHPPSKGKALKRTIIFLWYTILYNIIYFLSVVLSFILQNTS